MVFTIRRHSNLDFEEKREITSMNDLMALMTEFK